MGESLHFGRSPLPFAGKRMAPLLRHIVPFCQREDDGIMWRGIPKRPFSSAQNIWSQLETRAYGPKNHPGETL